MVQEKITEEISENDIGNAEEVLGNLVETVETPESIPEVKAVEEVDVGKMVSSLSWAPLESEKLEIHGEEIIHGLMTRIPGLVVRTSPNQHQSLSFGEKRGRVVCKFWFTKSRIVLETAELDGKSYSVLASRELNEKNGLGSKVRLKVLSEIRAYIKNRGW